MHPPLLTHPAPPPRGPLGGLVLAAALLFAAVLGLHASAPRDAALTVTDPPPGFTAPAGRFQWPLAPPHPVLRPFQPPSTPYGPGHRGVDIGGVPGEPVLAAAGGVVLYAGPLAGRSLVSIEHEGGLRTSYEPVRPSVRVGQPVTSGQVIGTLLPGHPGCPATPPAVCLHWGAYRDGVYLDPLLLLGTGHVRLLPWNGVT